MKHDLAKNNYPTPVKHGTREISNEMKNFAKLKRESIKSLIFTIIMTISESCHNKVIKDNIMVQFFHETSHLSKILIKGYEYGNNLRFWLVGHYRV